MNFSAKSKPPPSGALEKGTKVAAFMGGMGREFDWSYADSQGMSLRGGKSPSTSSRSWRNWGCLRSARTVDVSIPLQSGNQKNP
jgi:hypothetical protein